MTDYKKYLDEGIFHIQNGRFEEGINKAVLRPFPAR